jgi:hypothetical protein
MEEITKFECLGDPILIWKEIEISIIEYNKQFPLKQILLITEGFDNDEVLFKMLELSSQIKKLNLQFIVKDAFEEDRDEMNLSLREIRNFGLYWSIVSGRSVCIDYHVTNKSNKPEKIDRLLDLYDPEHFSFALSGENQTLIDVLREYLTSLGYNIKW